MAKGEKSVETTSDIFDTESSKTLFNDVPIGLMIIDERTNLTDANEYIFKYFKKDKVDVKGQRFGNLFNCSNAVSEKVTCGTGKGCQNCEIRKSMLDVFESDKDIKEMELCHEFIFNRRKITKWFAVNVKLIERLKKTKAFVALTDITSRKLLEEELTFLGITDELTGLFNRRFILKKLQALTVSEIEEDFLVSIAMIDIDRFKHVNDTYGHLTGDKVLMKLAETIKSSTRSTDFVGRYGGEEFLLIFNTSSAANSHRILKRIAEKFKDCMIDEIDGPLAFSGGLIETSYGKIQDLGDMDLIKKVDDLLYRAKDEGRNRIISEIL